MSKTYVCEFGKKRQHFGSSFEDFLKEEGIYDEATAHAIKRVITWQIEKAMKAEAKPGHPEGAPNSNGRFDH